MVAIGFALLGIGLVVAVLLAVADPVLLSRINGERSEGGRGRFIKVDKADIVQLPSRSGGEHREPKAA
ncbi:hypothetical protein SAMN05444920_112193 [Nonomuraea solani]|uniref:Uncharacterized protein n=1 Tax=Nonomuraea solani TaxID=1144553 RepID=A0A1H6EME7_9ACTN|nr:hypothetical protein [Nonomuraea solani]SEG99050.1 hypothetical protein SAMN05444920_112193 [Nonomuraea solani]